MKKLAAHYVFDGQKIYKQAAIALDGNGKFVGIEPLQIEPAQTIFYDGLLCPGFCGKIKIEDARSLLDLFSVKEMMLGDLAPVIQPFRQGEPCSIIQMNPIDFGRMTITSETKIRRVF